MILFLSSLFFYLVFCHIYLKNIWKTFLYTHSIYVTYVFFYTVDTGGGDGAVNFTQLVATVDDLTDMLNYDSEDIDGMDDDEGQGQNSLPARRGMATSWYDVCMIDTPNDAFDDDKEDPVEDKPPGTQSEHRCPPCRSQSRHLRENNTSTGGDSTPDNEDPVEIGSK